MIKHKPILRFGILLAGILLFISNTTLAQINLTVTGLVIADNGELPIEGVTVSIENTGIGSVTNSDGRFIIVLHTVVNQTDSLTLSYVGFNTKKVSLADATLNNNLIIKLEASITNLKEVEIKPLSIRSLLDSIINHNTRLFISPVELKGYYREMVYTNSKCTEFSDALCAYYFDRSSTPNGQFKIDASRCLKAKKEKLDHHNYEGTTESIIDPNDAFRIAMFIHLKEDYFKGKTLADYDYNIEQNEDNLKIVISPKAANQDEYYQVTLFLKNDLTLKSFHLSVPLQFASLIKEKSILGIHAGLTGFDVTVNYSSLSGHIYPSYYNIAVTYYFHGKILGTIFNQVITNKSEFLATEVNDGGNPKPYQKKAIYKKGNICGNGTAISDALLKNYTIIKLSQKDSVAIQSFVNK